MGKNKFILVLGIAVFIITIAVWVFIESSKPLTGIEYPDQGRDHIPITEEFEYNSNPPTSGKHNADWTRAGVYESPKGDPYLVHSLEHGYVIISYNCAFKQSFIKTAFAHGIEEDLDQGPFATESAKSEATLSADLSEDFRNDECHKLVDQLILIFEKKGKSKLIVIPRPNLDAKIALTSWRYLDKFNQFDESRILKFIDAHRNKGPEQTME